MESRMREYERQPQNGSPGVPGDAGFSAVREAAERMLAAGDAAIERNFSDDSEEFLRGNRQLGGSQ